MKKVLTLVELIAVLTILAIIALIITPNILVSIKDYEKQSYDTEIQAIADAAKNWATDHIDEIPVPNGASKMGLYVPLQELVQNGYFQEKVADPKNGGKFDDSKHETFVIIVTELLKDEFGVKRDNYRYTYEAYTSQKEYIEKTVLKYANDKKLTTIDSSTGTVNVTGEQLISEKYVPTITYIYNTNKQQFKPITSSSSYTLKIKRTGRSEETYEYEYSVTIN